MNTDRHSDAGAHLLRLEELREEIAILRRELGLTSSAFHGIPMRAQSESVSHPASPAGFPTLAA
jgi:hypothetical protein